MNAQELISHIHAGGADEPLTRLYGAPALETQRQRYTDLLGGFIRAFGNAEDVSFFSAPGRIEIGGNHTDHNNGCVLAAAVDIDIVAAAAAAAGRTVTVASDRFPTDRITLEETDPKPEERNTSAALIRGVTAAFQMRNLPVGGFHAYTSSQVWQGSGLSSSAAYEVLLGAIINGLFCQNTVSSPSLAQMAQYAENVYFGKPSGLMDQMASAFGGLISIDFASPGAPAISPLWFDFEKAGLAVCLVDTGSSHADLTDAYAAIPREMKAVAAALGQDVLRPVSAACLTAQLPQIRQICGDRAALRAFHFIDENERAQQQAQSLQSGDLPRFLRLVNASGYSSATHLQNLHCDASCQGIALSLSLADRVLDGTGACRVHGGGFGGTTLHFIPIDKLNTFTSALESVFGAGSCRRLSLRRVGAVQVI